MPAISEKEGAVRVSIYVQPRASRTEVVGDHGDSIKLRVAAPPVDGEANQEVVRFLAELLELPTGAVNVVSGQSSRRKIIEITGVSAEAVQRKLHI